MTTRLWPRAITKSLCKTVNHHFQHSSSSLVKMFRNAHVLGSMLISLPVTHFLHNHYHTHIPTSLHIFHSHYHLPILFRPIIAYIHIPTRHTHILTSPPFSLSMPYFTIPIHCLCVSTLHFSHSFSLYPTMQPHCFIPTSTHPTPAAETYTHIPYLYAWTHLTPLLNSFPSSLLCTTRHLSCTSPKPIAYSLFTDMKVIMHEHF